MKDFKKMPKMACGGKVKKMSEGGNTSSKDIQYYADKRSPESKAAAEQRMTEYKEGKEKSSAQFKENMSNIGKDYDKQIAEAKSKYVKPAKADLSGGARGLFSDLKTAMEKPAKTSSTKGGGSMGGGDMSGMKGLDKPYKRGGKVKK